MIEGYLSGIDLEALERIMERLSKILITLEEAIRIIANGMRGVFDNLADGIKKVVGKIEEWELRQKLHKKRSKIENQRDTNIIRLDIDQREKIKAFRRERKPP